MAFILEVSLGKYFAWQCDDDFCSPHWLERVHAALVKFSLPLCAITSYERIEGDIPGDLVGRRMAGNGDKGACLLPGREFLRGYFEHRFEAMGSAVFYEIGWLRKIGGMPLLCDSRAALYGEYLLLVQCGLLDRVVYLDQPLVYFRVHPGSWSSNHDNMKFVWDAGVNIMARSVGLFQKAPLRGDFRGNFRDMLRLVCGGVRGRLSLKNEWSVLCNMLGYLMVLHSTLKPLGFSSCYWLALYAMACEALGFVGIALRVALKAILPPPFVRVLKRLKAVG